MKKVLVTGSSGFVGKHLRTFLEKQGTNEILTPSRKELALLDASAVTDFIETNTPDQIYHLAALTSPADSFKDPTDTITNNIVAELNLLEALKNAHMTHTRILIVSTSEVYGMIDSVDLPADEQTAHRPISPYAVSKIAQDYLGLQYYLSYGLDVVRIRPFNHIGSGQTDKFVLPAFAKQIAEIEKGMQDAVISVGNLEAKRDFTDVRDIVRAYILLMEKGVSGEVYNIGSGKSYKIADLLDKLLALSHKKISVKIDPDKLRPVDIKDIVCDYSKFNKLTGWQPEIPIDETLKEVLEYWREVV